MEVKPGTRDTVRFLLGGELQQVSNCDPTRTVLEFLREDKQLAGTKEGCAEGDCGACTVVIGELHGDDIRYRAVNSCIQFLATLDGKQLLTVEHLGRTGEQKRGQRLHAVQQAMVEQHGSQCGFCTPGFVMSLFAMFQNDPDTAATRTDIELGLAGNLCRCTGYAPIVRAAEQALRAQRKDRFMQDKKRRVEQLQALRRTRPLAISHGERRFFAPTSCEELCTLLQRYPDAVMLAGGTDVGLWVTKQMRKLDSVIYLSAVQGLQELEEHDHHLAIGAAVSYSDAIQAISHHYPAFEPMINRLGSVQIRNAGTIGGNIANGSPIGDMPPGLIAAGARLELRGSQGSRVIALEDYFIRYGQQDLLAGEFVEKILLPLPEAHRIFATYKISKRFEQDISALCAAFSLQVHNGTVSDARVCYGGMAEIPKRARTCEQALNGSAWSQQTIDDAMRVLAEDFTPITDLRASADYRMRVAKNLLQRFYLEHTDHPYPVRLGQRFVQDVADA